MAENFLEMKSGPHDGERFPLVKERTVIGRHPSCDIVIEESAASRHHAAVTFTGTGFAIEDLGSRNGTLLNGRRLVGTHELELGDELVISGQQRAFVSDSPAIIGSARVSGTIQEEILEASGGEAMIVSQVDLPRPSPHNPAGGQAEAKLRAVLGFNRAIGASLSLEEVLPRLLEGVFGICHQADRAFVLLADKESKRLVLRARKIKGAPEPGPLRLSLSLIDRVAGSHLIDLGDVVARAAHAVNELAVIGQQQQARGVLVKTAHCLHAAGRGTEGPLAQRAGQQGVDRRPGRRLLRALMAGRLVQHQIGQRVVAPERSLNRKVQPQGLEIGMRVIAHGITDLHPALLDEPDADPTRAKTLAEKNVLQLHGRIVAVAADDPHSSSARDSRSER